MLVAHTLDAILPCLAVPLLVFAVIVIGAVLVVVRAPQRRSPKTRPRGFEVITDRDEAGAGDDERKL